MENKEQKVTFFQYLVAEDKQPKGRMDAYQEKVKLK